MLRATDFKKHVFHSQNLFGAEEVGAILAVIEQGGSNLENKTLLKSELCSLKHQENPIRELVDEQRVKLKGIQKIQGTLLPTFFNAGSGEFFDRCQAAFPNVRCRFTVQCAQIATGHEFSVFAELNQNACWIGYYESVNKDEELQKRAERLSYYIALWKLPLLVKLQNDCYIIEHTQQGKVEFGSVFADDKAPTTFMCAVSPNSSEQMASKFTEILSNPGTSAKNGDWVLRRTNIKGSAIPIEAFNKMGFPGKQIECIFAWHLDSYKDFRAMAEMAKRGDNEAGQGLVEFTFGSGMKCLLAAVCFPNGLYKLLFTFDQPESAAELEKMLKVKLVVGE